MHSHWPQVLGDLLDLFTGFRGMKTDDLQERQQGNDHDDVLEADIGTVKIQHLDVPATLGNLDNVDAT